MNRYTSSGVVPFAIEIGGRPGVRAAQFIRSLFHEEGIDTDIKITDVWATLGSCLQTGLALQVISAHNILPVAGRKSKRSADRSQAIKCIARQRRSQ